MGIREWVVNSYQQGLHKVRKYQDEGESLVSQVPKTNMGVIILKVISCTLSPTEILSKLCGVDLLKPNTLNGSTGYSTEVDETG